MFIQHLTLSLIIYPSPSLRPTQSHFIWIPVIETAPKAVHIYTEEALVENPVRDALGEEVRGTF